MNYFTNERDEPRMGRLILAGLAVVVLVTGLVIGGKFAGWWFSNATANTRGNVSVHNQINGNGSYRIAAYDHFFDLCADVQTEEVAIDSQSKELATTTDPQRKLVLQASIDAETVQRADDINHYNQDARKAGTLGQFRSSDLPFQLDATEETTSCTS